MAVESVCVGGVGVVGGDSVSVSALALVSVAPPGSPCTESMEGSSPVSRATSMVERTSGTRGTGAAASSATARPPCGTTAGAPPHHQGHPECHRCELRLGLTIHISTVYHQGNTNEVDIGG